VAYIPNPFIIPVGVAMGILLAMPFGPINLLGIQRAVERGFEFFRAGLARRGTIACPDGSLDHPTSGVLLYRGDSISDLPDPAAYRASEIGFIFQAFHLLPTFTATENVQIPMFGTGRSLSERRERAAELLKLVGLEDRRDQFPSKLSGGERQRVAIARSLANEPSLLLADEPTGNLDSKNAHLILDLIVRLHQEQGRTMVMVTHDPSIAERAGRILQMMDGKIVSDQLTPRIEP